MCILIEKCPLLKTNNTISYKTAYSSRLDQTLRIMCRLIKANKSSRSSGGVKNTRD